MYLNDLNSSQHNVKKLNKILSQTFNHEVDLSEMSTDSLDRMLNTTNAKMMAIKESDLKYWENPQYNKLGLIAHQIKEYLSEIAPTRTDGKKMKKESTVMEADLDQAEVLLAAQELVDQMQGMVEDVAEMQVQKLMPIVDAMKEQVGFETAEAYNNAADAALGTLLDAMKQAKEAVENATLAARGEPVPGGETMPTDMGMDDAEADLDAPMDMEADDDFGGDETEAGEENPIGRELKGESALAQMEKDVLSEKKFLESKDKLLKMVESGSMTMEHFINVINELKNEYGVEINPNWGKMRQKYAGAPMTMNGKPIERPSQKRRPLTPDERDAIGGYGKYKTGPDGNPTQNMVRPAPGGAGELPKADTGPDGNPTVITKKTNQQKADDAMGRRGGFTGDTGQGMLAMPMPRPNLQNKRRFDPSGVLKTKPNTGPDGNPTGPVGTKPKLDPDAVAGMFTTKAKLTPAQRRRLSRTGRVA
tara:strand:+ start:1636 stop:3063 length:1428 start_codon:yes stop_codon:yes gene_type:complete